MKWIAGLAAGAVWLMACMPAMAQSTPKALKDLTEEQLDEFYCVYDVLDFFADTKALADGYMTGEVDTPAYEAQMEELDAATLDCEDEFDWAADRAEAASMFGFYGVLVDELEGRLAARGMTEAQIIGVYDVVDGLPDADLDKFATGAWSGDAALLERLRTALSARGVSGEAGVEATYLAEAYAVASLVTYEWLSKMLAN